MGSDIDPPIPAEETAELLRTSSVEHVAVVRSLLEAHGILHVVHGLDRTGLSVLGSVLTPFSGRPVEARIEVPASRLREAETLLESAAEPPDPNQKDPNLDDPNQDDPNGGDPGRESAS